MVFKLKPRNDIFYYFDQLSDAILDAANFLLQFIEQPGENPSQNWRPLIRWRNGEIEFCRK